VRYVWKYIKITRNSLLDAWLNRLTAIEFRLIEGHIYSKTDKTNNLRPCTYFNASYVVMTLGRYYLCWLFKIRLFWAFYISQCISVHSHTQNCLEYFLAIFSNNIPFDKNMRTLFSGYFSNTLYHWCQVLYLHICTLPHFSLLLHVQYWF